MSGDFSLRTGVSIGNRTLATYSYTNDRNHYLSALDYGNEDSVNYTYDDKGRLTEEIYEDGLTYVWEYDDADRDKRTVPLSLVTELYNPN